MSYPSTTADGPLLGGINEADLETPPCPLCRSEEATPLHRFDPFRVVLCRDCGLRYLSPRLREYAMKRIYQDKGYFERGEIGYREYASQEGSLRMTFRRFLRELRKQGIARGRLLEIGCGYGYFLDEARDFFSYRAGLELSQDAGLHAQRLSGADIHIGDVNSLPSGFNDFGVIALINVIEHVYEPVEFLCSLRRRLGKGGRIVLATPDIGSFWYTIMRGRWASFKVPEHVAFYARKQITLLLQKAGFSDILQVPFAHAFPLGVIGARLGIDIPQGVGRKNLWLPKTMLAVSGRRENG